jgi:cyanate lyase
MPVEVGIFGNSFSSKIKTRFPSGSYTFYYFALQQTYGFTLKSIILEAYTTALPYS